MDPLFALQKAGLWLVLPSNLAFLMLGGGLAVMALGRRRGGGLLASAGLLLALLPSLLPVTGLLARPLEGAFPPGRPPAEVTGVVVLGGAVNPKLTADRGPPALTDGAERMTAAVELALRFPEARLIFSGGSSAVLGRSLSESEVARRFFEAYQLADRFEYEGRSRTTLENARFSLELANPAAGEVWLLVTSALHMPRAWLAFERAGWSTLPYPVDYLTSDRLRWWPSPNLIGNLAKFDRAVGEWASLLAFRALGYTDRLLPLPRGAVTRP